MQMTLHVRDGEVVFHCTGCARDFYVDPHRPFVPQLRSMSYGHHCYSLDDWEEPANVLVVALDEGPSRLPLTADG